MSEAPWFLMTETQQPPASRFEFVTMASARARQLLRGCLPRVEGERKPARIAQREVKSGALWQDDQGDRATQPE
jgi:DNA-directed RNA polymerase subunit K/omega